MMAEGRNSEYAFYLANAAGTIIPRRAQSDPNSQIKHTRFGQHITKAHIDLAGKIKT
jgi:hypothetical protein